MELDDELRLTTLELGPQHVAKEVVIAVPATVVVERDDEQVRVLERREHLCRVRPTEHCVAERPRHPIEDGRAHQELDLDRLQMREVLRAQVVGDEAIVACELLESRGALGGLQ